MSYSSDLFNDVPSSDSIFSILNHSNVTNGDIVTFN